MDYYNLARKSAIDIQDWIAKDEHLRESWSKFCRKQMVRYGFAPKRTYKMLKELYPQFDIEKDHLIVEEAEA